MVGGVSGMTSSVRDLQAPWGLTYLFPKVPHCSSTDPTLGARYHQILTCVVNDEAGIAHRCITAEGEEEAVAATFDAARELGAIEASYERAERVPSIVDVEKIIARLQVKSGEQKQPIPTPVRSNRLSLGLPRKQAHHPMGPNPEN